MIDSNRWETVALGGAVLLLLVISVASLWASDVLKPDAPPRAPWCLAGQVPVFQFGFGALAQQIGNVMGVPIECEHGEDASDNTFQATTTGLAQYDWCTNTPGFTAVGGQEHWILTSEGVEHWTGDASSPRPLPVVRVPDLRHLCLTGP